MTNAAAAIATPANDVVVSAASIWEIEIKQALGRLQVPETWLDAIERSGFSALPILATDAVLAGRPPRHHPDPFDRMLIAQAIRLDAVIVSRDTAFAPYGVRYSRRRLWRTVCAAAGPVGSSSA